MGRPLGCGKLAGGCALGAGMRTVSLIVVVLSRSSAFFYARHATHPHPTHLRTSHPTLSAAHLRRHNPQRMNDLLLELQMVVSGTAPGLVLPELAERLVGQLKEVDLCR